MRISDIMTSSIMSLAPEDTVGKAYRMMIEHSIHQVPVVEDQRYLGMVYAKQLIASNVMPTSKIKGHIISTPTLSAKDDIEKATELVIGSGNRALPVVEKEKLIGILSETDIAQIADFGDATVDQVMSGAIVIDENASLPEVTSKMRRYNISRLPVINENGALIGVVNILDAGSITAAPTERTSKSAAITGNKARVKGNVRVRDVARRAVSVEQGARLNELTKSLKEGEGIIVVSNNRPIGIVTPKDVLELILPKKGKPAINIAHLEDAREREEIEEQLSKFLKKVQGRLGIDIPSIVVYVDKHKTRKYSIRCRLITDDGMINARAVGYDPISASKELIRRLNRQIEAEHSKVKGRKQRMSARRA